MQSQQSAPRIISSCSFYISASDCVYTTLPGVCTIFSIICYIHRCQQFHGSNSTDSSNRSRGADESHQANNENKIAIVYVATTDNNSNSNNNNNNNNSNNSNKDILSICLSHYQLSPLLTLALTAAANLLACITASAQVCMICMSCTFICMQCFHYKPIVRYNAHPAF